MKIKTIETDGVKSVTIETVNGVEGYPYGSLSYAVKGDSVTVFTSNDKRCIASAPMHLTTVNGVIVTEDNYRGTLSVGLGFKKGSVNPPTPIQYLVSDRPPTPADGVAGNYWLDSNTGKKYGPKTEGTWSVPKRVSKNQDRTAQGGTASILSAFGNRVTFLKPGKITGLWFCKPYGSKNDTRRWRVWRDEMTQVAYTITEGEPASDTVAEGLWIRSGDIEVGFNPNDSFMCCLDGASDTVLRWGGYAGSVDADVNMTGTFQYATNYPNGNPAYGIGMYPGVQSAGNNDYGIDVEWVEAIGFEWPEIG